MRTERILIIFIVIFAAARFLFLDADTSMFKGIEDLEDEGYWAYDARNKALFDEWVSDDFVQSASTGPLWLLLLSISFNLVGVSLFSVRLVSAIAGVASILLLYLILRKQNQRLGIIGAFVLALNNAFFVYNRLGHLESLIIAFFLLHFFLLTFRSRKILFLFAGSCLSLAVLVKLTASYFILAIIFYFTALMMRKELKYEHIIFYIAGILIVAVPVAYFYYIPYYPVFESTLKGLSHPESFLVWIPYNICRLATTHYYSLPSVFLLLVSSLVYFKERKILTVLAHVRRNIHMLSEVEIIALSWFLGYLIGLLFSDFGDRRFTLLIIPLVIFSAMLFKEGNTALLSGAEYIKPLIFIIMIVPLLNLIPHPLAAYSRIANIEPKVGILSLLTLLVIVVAVLIYSIILRYQPRWRNLVKAHLPKIALFSLLISVSLNLVISYNKILTLTYYSVPNELLVISAVGLSIALFVGIVKYAAPLKKVLVYSYLVVSFTLIPSALVLPSFSIKNASEVISRICSGDEWIIGHLGHVLSLENRLRPLWWMPNNVNYREMNIDAVKKYQPKYYLRTIRWDGKRVDGKDEWPTPEQINAPLSYLTTMELLPILGKPRAVVELYKIEYRDK